MLARGWLVYQMTNSPFMLGVVTGAYSIPIIVLALPGGVLADRAGKRNLMVAAEGVQAFTSVGIALLLVTGHITIWHLMLTSFINGIAFSFGQPAKQAIIPEIVERKVLMNAIALGSAGFNAMRILAPSIGGFLLAFAGMAPVFFIGAALSVIAALFLLFLSVKSSPQEKTSSSFSDDIKSGLKYLYGNKTVYTVFLLITVTTLFTSPFQYLLPVFAKDILKVGEVGLGWMMAATGIGAVISNLIIASLGDNVRKSYLLLGLMGFLGVFLTIFSHSTVFAVSFIFLLVLGMCATGFNTMSNTMLQIYSSMEMRGRVMSIMTVAFGMAPLGTVPLGALAEAIGAPWALTMGGLLVSLTGLGVFTFYRSFRQLK